MTPCKCGKFDTATGGAIKGEEVLPPTIWTSLSKDGVVTKVFDGHHYTSECFSIEEGYKRWVASFKPGTLVGVGRLPSDFTLNQLQEFLDSIPEPLRTRKIRYIDIVGCSPERKVFINQDGDLEIR